MRTLLLLSLCFFLLLPQQSRADEIDLSSPQATYDTCYSTINLESEKKDAERKIKRCLTPTAQKAVMSYAVLGGYFIDSLKDRHGAKKHPNFLLDLNLILEKNELSQASKQAFRSANMPRVLANIIQVYAANPLTKEQLHYTERSLQGLKIFDDAATGLEMFKLKIPLPANKLELRFVKIDDEWLINYISPRP